MGKRTAKPPLALISQNESGYGTRSRKQNTSTSDPDEGKENASVQSVRRETRNAASEQQIDISTSSSDDRRPVSASQKRARSSALTGPALRSGLRRTNKSSRRDESLANSQTSAPVRVAKSKHFLQNDKPVETFQITATADACSLSDDGVESGAVEGKAVQHNRDSSGSPHEQRPSACHSLDQNAESGEAAELVRGSEAPVAPALQCSLKEVTGVDAGNSSSMKTYRRRKASTGGFVPKESVPRDGLGTPKNTVELPGRGENNGMDLAEFCRSDEKRAAVARATDALQSAYDKLYKKYQNLKTRQLTEAEGAFAEQSKRIEVFSRAADDLVENLRISTSEWEQQEETISSARVMEAAYIECQNDLVMERAKNLELRQQLENAELRGSQLLENAELRGSKLLQDLLQNTTQLTILDFGKSEIMFSHNQSGYEFKLEQNRLAEDVGGKDALLYTVISAGTILRVAPDWMRSEIVFDMAQLQVFFQRILAVALCGGVSM